MNIQYSLINNKDIHNHNKDIRNHNKEGKIVHSLKVLLQPRPKMGWSQSPKVYKMAFRNRMAFQIQTASQIRMASQIQTAFFHR